MLSSGPEQELLSGVAEPTKVCSGGAEGGGPAPALQALFTAR